MEEYRGRILEHTIEVCKRFKLEQNRLNAMLKQLRTGRGAVKGVASCGGEILELQVRAVRRSDKFRTPR